ncbi:MAG: uroporphyrinogen decarboxylase family protein, partial [Armatimonadota bacterium]
CDIWEMDRQEAGWYFDTPAPDDWGCGWKATEVKNMGQVVDHPLADASALNSYTPPDPKNPFYYERLKPELQQAGDRYTVVTSHFALIERLHMLRGFSQTMEDLYLNPEFVETVLDMILEFKVRQFEELHRRFGDAVHGVFMTDDWGTQQGTFIRPELFDRFFAPRYETLFGAIHDHGWHVMLHSCGRINEFVPRLIEVGADVLNMQQPQAYDLVEFGEQFKGRVCFLTTCDIQTTLPSGSEEKVREEARQLIEHWSVPEGGFIVFNYGDPEALAVDPSMSRVMFEEFADLADYWQ